MSSRNTQAPYEIARCLSIYRTWYPAKIHQPNATPPCPTRNIIRKIEDSLPSSTSQTMLAIALCHSLPQELLDLVRDFFGIASLESLKGRERIITPDYTPPALLSLEPWRAAAIPIYYDSTCTWVFDDERVLGYWLKSIAQQHSSRINHIKVVYHEDYVEWPGLYPGQVAGMVASSKRKQLEETLTTYVDPRDANWAVTSVITIEMHLAFADGDQPQIVVAPPPGEAIGQQ